MTTHETTGPEADAIERVAEALANEDTDANWYWDEDRGEIFLTWDDLAADDDEWIDRGGEHWTKGRPYYRRLARAAITAIPAPPRDCDELGSRAAVQRAKAGSE